MEVFGSDGKKVFWEVVDNHVVEDETDHNNIGLWRFDFSFFYKDKKGVGIEGSSDFPYLFMLIKLWTVYLKTRLKMMNLKVDKDNGKSMGIGK